MSPGYFLSGALLFLATVATATPRERAAVILSATAPRVLDARTYEEARSELAQHIELCGEGVVDTVVTRGAPNRCSYNVRVDDVFLRPLASRTGLIRDENWPYREGVQFMEATESEMEDVPEEWDLSWVGPMIRIFRQRCGDCWAQATRANLEQLIATFDGALVPLSTQTLISSCCPHGSCSGGYMTTPDWVVKYGLPLEERDPYLGRNSSCKFDLKTAQFDYKLESAPWVGNSLMYSRYHRPEQRTGPKVRNVQAMMWKYKSSAVVTIQAISQSGGIIDSCSAINSGGNHMQNIVGWYPNPNDSSDVIARVQNSWGTDHGQGGYTHMKWECGEGKLNRGLARSARVGIYKPVCRNTPDAYTGPTRRFDASRSAGVVIGRTSRGVQRCSWAPEKGLRYLSADHCEAMASPEMPTEYHLTAETECGRATSMVLVVPQGGDGRRLGENRILTPLGIAHLDADSGAWD